MTKQLNEFWAHASDTVSNQNYLEVPGTSEDVAIAALSDVATLLKGKYVHVPDLSGLARNWPKKAGFLPLADSITSDLRDPLVLLRARISVSASAYGAGSTDITLFSILSENSGFTLCTPKADTNKWVRMSLTVTKIGKILADAQIAVDARKAEEDEAARIAAEEEAAREARRQQNRERRAIIQAEDAELEAALAAGDQATIDRIAEVRAERFDAEMQARADEARQLAADAAEKIDGTSTGDTSLPDDLDHLSFIYGWLAANVDYLYAKLPGWDKFAERNFLKRYPNVSRTATAGEPGYTVTDDKLTSGGYKWQLANEYHVHFKRGTVQKAPEFVRTFLGSIRSKRTGEASQVKGNISSNALAQYLIVDLGFWFDRTENTDAYRTCKKYANDAKSFDLGYNWTGTKKQKLVASFDAELEAARRPFEQDFEDVLTEAKSNRAVGTLRKRKRLNEATETEKTAASKKFWNSAKRDEIDEVAFHTAFGEELEALGLMDLFSDEGRLNARKDYGRIAKTGEENPDSWAIKALKKLWALEYKPRGYISGHATYAYEIPGSKWEAAHKVRQAEYEKQEAERKAKEEKERKAAAKAREVELNGAREFIKSCISKVDPKLVADYEAAAGVKAEDGITLEDGSKLGIHFKGWNRYYPVTEKQLQDEKEILEYLEGGFTKTVKYINNQKVAAEFKKIDIFKNNEKNVDAILLTQSGKLYEVGPNWQGDFIVRVPGARSGESATIIDEPFEIIYTATHWDDGNNITMRDSHYSRNLSWNSKHVDKIKKFGIWIPDEDDYGVEYGYIGSSKTTTKVDNPKSSDYSHADGIDSWAHIYRIDGATD